MNVISFREKSANRDDVFEFIDKAPSIGTAFKNVWSQNGWDYQRWCNVIDLLTELNLVTPREMRKTTRILWSTKDEAISALSQCDNMVISTINTAYDESTRGMFYIISIVPDIKPERVKLGFSNNISKRLQRYRTLSPTAEIATTWPCKRSWETVIIESITRKECTSLSREVFDCEDIDRLMERGDTIFSLLPSLNGS